MLGRRDGCGRVLAERAIAGPGQGGYQAAQPAHADTLRQRRRLEQRHRARLEQRHQQQACREAADVRPPGDGPGLGARCCAAEEGEVIGHGDVDENAEADDERGRCQDGRDVEDEYEDTRARMEQEVARHDRGDRSAGADQRRRGCGDALCDGRQGAAHQEERGIAPVAEGILDVVAENSQRDQIGNDMQEAAMEKLMGEQAGDSVKRAGPWPEMPQLYWDEGEVLPADEAELAAIRRRPPSSA